MLYVFSPLTAAASHAGSLAKSVLLSGVNAITTFTYTASHAGCHRIIKTAQCAGANSSLSKTPKCKKLFYFSPRMNALVSTLRKTFTSPKTNESEEMFRKTVDHLMSAPLWTFGAFRHYQEKMLELLGGTGFKGWLQKNQKNPILDETRLKIRILAKMTPFELASNHKSVFTHETIQQLAKAADTTPRIVEELLKEHDILRADRRWYQIRSQFRRELPRTPEDKEILAKRDRPWSETEKEEQKEGREKMIEQLKERRQLKNPPRRPHHQFSKSPDEDKWTARSNRYQPASAFYKIRS